MVWLNIVVFLVWTGQDLPGRLAGPHRDHEPLKAGVRADRRSPIPGWKPACTTVGRKAGGSGRGRLEEVDFSPGRALA